PEWIQVRADESQFLDGVFQPRDALHAFSRIEAGETAEPRREAAHHVGDRFIRNLPADRMVRAASLHRDQEGMLNAGAVHLLDEGFRAEPSERVWLRADLFRNELLAPGWTLQAGHIEFKVADSVDRSKRIGHGNLLPSWPVGGKRNGRCRVPRRPARRRAAPPHRALSRAPPGR